jgi:hypothetical protein
VRGLERATLFNVGLVIAFIVKNVICFTLEVKDITGLVKRFSVICTINLVLLALRGYMNIVAS